MRPSLVVLVFAFLALAAVGCGSAADCRNGTLRLALLFDETTRNADELAVTLTLPAGSPKTITVKRSTAATSDTLDVSFSSYPVAGSTADLSIAVRKDSQTIVTVVPDHPVMFTPSCTFLRLSLTGADGGSSGSLDAPANPDVRGNGGDQRSDASPNDLEAAAETGADTDGDDASGPDVAVEDHPQDTEQTPEAPIDTGPSRPEAPLNVNAAAGDGTATVNWSPPPSNGDRPILYYTIAASPGGAVLMVDGTVQMVTFTGLTNGTSYTFTVSATNEVGMGPRSQPSNPATPQASVKPPAAPSGVQAMLTAPLTITVNWQAPSDNGGASISEYTITAQPDNRTASVGASVTMVVMNGLTLGTNYTFTVTAANSAGRGPASGASNPIVAADVPGPPMALSATALSGGRAMLSWAAANANYSPVTGYVITSVPAAISTTAGAAATSATVSGLAAGMSYTFQVAATNALGTGPPASTGMIMSGDPPGTPGGVTATAIAGGKVMLSWTAPASNGSAISGYTISSNPGGVTVMTSSTSTQVGGLTLGTAYTFDVRATNASGTGPPGASNQVTIADVPGAPGGVTATVITGGKVMLSWTAPASNGSPITGYSVSSNPGGSSVTTSSTSAQLDGLTLGTAYTFDVRATNTIGTGSAGTSNQVTPADAPGAPTAVTAMSPSGLRAIVSWTAAAANGSPVTTYTVTSTPSSQMEMTTSSPVTVTGLQKGQMYTFSVTATNAVGTGPAATSNSVTPNCVNNTRTINAVDWASVQYGTTAFDQSTVSLMEAYKDNRFGTNYDISGWAKFSISQLPDWASVTAISLTAFVNDAGGATAASVVVHVSNSDDWSHAGNPTAAQIPRTTVLSGAVPAGSVGNPQTFPLNVVARDWSQDVKDHYITLGISNAATLPANSSSFAYYYTADNAPPGTAPYITITSCE